MPKVAVVTDSSSCLPGELIERHGIITVPLSFLFDEQLYYDGALSSHDFYDRLRASHRLPTTTSPAPGRFLEAFRQAQQAGASAALCLTLSASYSGTYSSARTAVDLAAQELPGFPVRALDTRGLAMAHGFTVLAAARAAEAGADLDEVAATAEAVRDRTHLVGAMDTMRYLAKGGRVPWIAHWASALLQIKPILAANADKVTGVGRVRTLGAAMERLVRYLAQRTQPGTPLHVAVMHADAPERAQELARRVRQQFSPAELIVTEFTSVMGIHIGPGFVGLAFYSETNGEAQRAVGAAGSTPARPPEDDVRTLEASLDPIPPPRSTATLLVLTGLPGSGKSHLARQLCQRHPMARLDSDALRQALFPHPSHSAEESARLFTACHALLDRLLARRIPAVLDATNLREVHRRPLFDLAKKHGASLFLVEMKATPELISQRLQARKRGDNPWDESEADIAVYERMKGEAKPIAEPHIVIDTSVDTGPALDKLVRELQAAT